MSTIPIPQGATIGGSSETTAIPQGATIGQSAPVESSKPPSTLETIGMGLNAMPNVPGMAPTGLGVGAVKGMAETVHGLGHLVAPTKVSAEMPESMQPQGAEQHIGNLIENIAEFMGGDEAFKALSEASRFSEITGIAKALEKHPALAKIVGSAFRSGAVSGAQQTAKTGSLSEGAAGAATGAVIGGAGEVLGKGLESISKDVAAEKAFQAKQAAHAVAKEGAEANIAKVADTVLQKHATALGTTVAPAESFGDAADKIRGAAQAQVFKVLDRESANEFATLQNEEKTAKGMMKRANTYEARNDAEGRFLEARNRIQDLIDQHQDKLPPGAYKAAKEAWRDAVTLDRVDSAIDRGFDTTKELADSAGKKRLGSEKTSKIMSYLNRIPIDDLRRTIGDRGIRNLSGIAESLQTPIMEEMAKSPLIEAMTRGTQGTELGFVGKAIKTGNEAKKVAVYLLANNPKAASTFLDGIKLKASPKLVVPLVLQALRGGAGGSY